MTEPTPTDTGSVELILRIEKLLTGGAGLARHEGQAVFVPLTAPGDQVRVRITKAKKGFAEAELLEILEPGPGRTEPPCGHYGDCGGCDLQHLAPAEQRLAKAAIVADCFQRLGKLDVTDLLAGPEPTGGDLGHRNRIRLFASPMGPYGLMRRGTHDVVPLDTCPVMPERFNADILPWLRMLPPVEQVTVRLDRGGNWLLSVFGPPARLRLLKKILAGLPEDGPPAPGCVGILFNNLPLWGRDYLVHEVAGHKFRVSARSFFQGNFAVTEEAVATIRSWLEEVRDAGRLGPLLGDIFCGVGLFSLALAHMFGEVVAIDADSHAVRDAENNVKRDPAARGKVTIHKGSAAQVLGNENLGAPGRWREACCVVDPPRAGLGKDGATVLLARAPRQILFMSCDPATLARDTAACIAAGYELKKLRVLDMFPQTSHIETLALLERTN
ncbi:MAG: class I SAM-dependent RNA methyltransferase [bacterium]|nr:class I SAM-dependent RNA methyltransferase [bacterium]